PLYTPVMASRSSTIGGLRSTRNEFLAGREDVEKRLESPTLRGLHIDILVMPLPRDFTRLAVHPDGHEIHLPCDALGRRLDHEIRHEVGDAVPGHAGAILGAAKCCLRQLVASLVLCDDVSVPGRRETAVRQEKISVAIPIIRAVVDSPGVLR